MTEIRPFKILSDVDPLKRNDYNEMGYLTRARARNPTGAADNAEENHE